MVESNMSELQVVSNEEFYALENRHFMVIPYLNKTFVKTVIYERVDNLGFLPSCERGVLKIPFTLLTFDTAEDYIKDGRGRWIQMYDAETQRWISPLAKTTQQRKLCIFRPRYVYKKTHSEVLE